MSRIGDNPYKRVQAPSSKGNSNQQQQRNPNQGQGQNKQGQGQGNGNGGNTPSEVHPKAAAKWGGSEATLSTPMTIKGNVGGAEQGKATVNINHRTPDGNAKQVDSFQTVVNPGGVVLDSWTVRGVKPEGSVSFEIKTENNTYKGSEFALKAPIKG